MSKWAALALSLMLCTGAWAQTPSSKTTSGISTDITTNQASGQGAAGTALKLRQTLLDMSVSYPNTYVINGFSGIDCTGTTDSATGLQAAIDAIPNSSFLYFPSDCALKIGSTINMTDRLGLTLGSFICQESSVGAPSFQWVGANNGIMFDIEHSDHPTFRGFRFGTDGVHSVDRFLKFDGVPGGGSHIGTNATVECNDFLSDGQSNDAYIAISISESVTTNHENYFVNRNSITCNNNQLSTNRAIDGVITNGATSLTSATANFVMGDAGKRIRLSRKGLTSGQDSIFFDTTIASVTNSTTVVLAATLTFGSTSPRTGVQITTGTSYGIGIYQGPSSNAKHTRLYSNLITGCDTSIYIAGGSVDIKHLGGGFGGTDIFLNNTVVDAIIIEQCETEGALRGLDIKGGVAPVTVIGCRIANVNQFADGFYKLGSGVTLIGSASVSSCDGSGTGVGGLNNPNGVVVGDAPNPVKLTSIGNQFGCSAAQVGFGPGVNLTLYGVASINDEIGNAANSQYIFGSEKIFMPSLPTSSSGLASGRLWSNSGVLTVVP